MDDNPSNEAVVAFIYPSGRDPGPPPTQYGLYVLAVDAWHGVFGTLVRSVAECLSREGDKEVGEEGEQGGDAVPLVGAGMVGTPEPISPVSEASTSTSSLDTPRDSGWTTEQTMDAHPKEECDRTEDVQPVVPAIADHPAFSPRANDRSDMSHIIDRVPPLFLDAAQFIQADTPVEGARCPSSPAGPLVPPCQVPSDQLPKEGSQSSPLATWFVFHLF